jgi:C_GCAxxG_C_C family probable redox protein
MKIPTFPGPRTDRRTFVRNAVACAGLGLVGSCSQAPETIVPAQAPAAEPQPVTHQTGAPRKAAMPQGSRETILSSVEHLADAHVRRCHHCAQASFLALDDVFGFGQPGILKALTPLPGIAERGETCGAVVGSLMALGLVHGRDRLDDWNAWRASLVPARTFCDRFQSEFGSTQCGDIVERLVGRRLNLYDPVELAQFQIAGATELTSRVVRKAVRLAAELILEPRHPVGSDLKS